jgi:ActR/RegA family two-component response regulator
MGQIIVILEFVNKFAPVMGKVIKWSKRRYYNRIDITDIKDKAHILFIDDQSFDVIERIRAGGWIVERVKDIKSLDDDRVRRAHVIFVDYKGVGKHLSNSEEGLGLIKALKKKYPKKRIILYSAHAEFSLADEVNHKIADDILPKNSDTTVYVEKIEQNARIALSL